MTKQVEASNWPKREDGTNKTYGEMTAEERKSVIKDSNKRWDERATLPEGWER